MKYTFKLTENQMQIIKLALDREIIRKKENNNPQTEEIKELADFFDRRIKDIYYK